jgi:hypothetical protein
VLRATVAQLLDAVCDAPVGKPAQPVESQGRPGAVAHQSFASEIVVARDGDAGV